VVPQTMELRDDFLHERSSSDWTPLRPLDIVVCFSAFLSFFLPACRTLGTNNCFLFLIKRKWENREEKEKRKKKRKKKERKKNFQQIIWKSVNSFHVGYICKLPFVFRQIRESNPTTNT